MNRMNNTSKHRRRGRTVLVYDAKILAKVWRLCPAYIVFLALWSLMWAGIDTAAVYFRNAMFNALDTSDAFGDVAVFILALAAFYLIVFIPDHIYSLIISPILDNRLRYRMHSELYRKAQRMDLACYDDPDFYNQFVWAMRESDNRAIAVVRALFNIVNRVISATAISALLLTINVWMGILMLVGVGVTLVVEYFGNRLWIRVMEIMNPLWRRESYITRVFNLSDYAKEMRTSGVGDMMTRDCEDTVEELNKLDIRYGKRFTLLYGVGFNIARRGTYYATILIMVFELSAGRVQLGGFAAAVASLWMLQSIMMNLADSLTELPKHALYIEKYFKFLEHENHLVSGREPVPAFESLTFENVSFAYASVFTDEETALASEIKEFERKEKGKTDADEEKPREKRPAVLKNVSFTIRKGEKTAIVGYNGAGKTTLIKLVMRLYDPTEGRILYNGRDIREYDLHEYRERIGAVFQDYRIFAATLGENVMGGGYERTPENESRIREALDSATFTERLEGLEKGLETPLTREIDKEGVNLSGGEAQKVAIARVFVRPYDLIIMDEPSSALDPVAEYELNHSILSAADSRESGRTATVIFISHRLSTTRFADRIFLFAGGELTEQGSHDELMALRGKYAEMFDMQAEKYRRGENMN
ncbi:MAG: ABC transporter ATP-binding protein [Clostridia bacterium]|nr:ABC transporter ATP-binding protein [Clostridia bacterium]